MCRRCCFACLLRTHAGNRPHHPPAACSAADGLSESNPLWNLLSLQPARSITPNTYVNTEPPLPSTTADRPQTALVNNALLSKTILNCRLVLSPPLPLRDDVEQQLEKHWLIHSIYIPRRKMGDKEGISTTGFCFEYSRRAINLSSLCGILQHLPAFPLQCDATSSCCLLSYLAGLIARTNSD